MIEDPKELLQRARKWIEDLRSGKFKQGRGRWYSNINDSIYPGYCCLGVCGSQFVDLPSTKVQLGISGVCRDVTNDEHTISFIEMMPIFLEAGYNWNNIIPEEVWRNEFLTIPYAYTINPGVLAGLNDSLILFDKIAWLLEETLIPHLELKINELHEDC